MLNVDYSRRLRGSGNFTHPMKPQVSGGHAGGNPWTGKSFYLFVGAILLFTGGMVVGLHLNQTESQYQKSNLYSGEVALKNKGASSRNKKAFQPIKEDSSLAEARKESSNSIEDSPAFFPKNLKYPPKMDQINYIIEIGTYEPTESSQVGKLILEEWSDFRGKIFRTSTGKLYAGYYYKQEDAKKALEKLRRFEKDDFTNADLKTVRF